MRNKKNEPDEQPEKSPVEQHVEEMLGPAPNDPRARSNNPGVTTPAPEVIATSSLEPTTAPIIPTDAFPKEFQEDAIEAPMIDPTLPEVAPADIPAATEEDPESGEVSDDPAEEAAVNDIAATESDEALAAQDAEIAQAFVAQPKKESFAAKFGHWLAKPKVYGSLIILILLGMGVGGAIPTSRYYVLNTAGVRSSVSVTVFDDSTQQPLKNVQVTLAQQVGKTDNEGKVRLSNVRLGASTLEVNRRAFAPLSKQVTIGWGSNPLGDVRLAPTGSQYSFIMNDFLSGKALDKAEANSGDSFAQADEKGKIVLTIDAADDREVQVTLKSEGYREETLKLNPDDKATKPVRMAPGRKHVFVSRRIGKADLYSIDVDGKNEKLLLNGTGFERDDIALAAHPQADLAAFVSTRDNVRNKEGFLLSSLSLINTKTGDKTDLGQSEKMQVVDWIGDRVVYVQIAAGTSAANPKRQRLMSYDYKTEDKKELASANYFNDVQVANGTIYYAPSGSSNGEVGFYKISADGNGKQVILNKEVWNVFRTQYDHLTLSVGQDWYDYKLGELQAGKISGAPADLKNRVYRDSPDKQQSLWVDARDGKGVLLEYNLFGDKSDKTLRSQSGISNPIYWLANNYVVYRIRTDQETADYVINLDGGEPRKLKDVTNTTGIDRWYYYQ